MRKLHMRKNDTPGLLITFCGLDGCGKTTVIRRLAAELDKNYMVFLSKEPTSFVRESNIFRSYMDTPNHEDYDYRSLSLLAASDRVQLATKVIYPVLEDGSIIVSDRYFYSCLANLRARGFDKDKWIYEVAQSIVKPDIAFFLDVPVDLAISRVRNRPDEKDRYIDVDLQYRLREEYLKICKANKGVLISTQQSEEETYRQISTAIERKIQTWKKR